MNRLKSLLIGAALVAASSALASAQPVNDRDRHEGRYEDRDHDRGYARNYDRDRHFDRDRDYREGFRDRDDYHYRVGERRYFNGFYWNWDGQRWCRQEPGVKLFLRF